MGRVLRDFVRLVFDFEDHPRRRVTVNHPCFLRFAGFAEHFVVRGIGGEGRDQVFVVFLCWYVPVLAHVLRRDANEPLAASAGYLVDALWDRLTKGLVSEEVVQVNVLGYVRRELAGGWQTVFHVLDPPLRRYFVVNAQVSSLPVCL